MAFCPVIPRSLGILGPVISASKIPTLYPFSFNCLAIKVAMDDLPTPPFPLITPIIFLTLFKGLFSTPQLPLSLLHPPLDGHVSHVDIKSSPHYYWYLPNLYYCCF